MGAEAVLTRPESLPCFETLLSRGQGGKPALVFETKQAQNVLSIAVARVTRWRAAAAAAAARRNLQCFSSFSPFTIYD